MVEIWDEARQAGLTEENLVAWIDDMEKELEQSQKLNFMRWNIMNTIVHQNPRIWGSYQAEVANVRRFMKERIAWMDKRLNYTYHPNGISVARADNNQPTMFFSLSGQPYGSDMNSLKPGVYIVRQGQTTKKIVIR